MNWLNKIVNEALKRGGSREVIVSSGVSPSGTYHLGTLREVLTAEAVAREIKNRGGRSRHIHLVDDLDVLRKVPSDVPDEFQKYLGMPLCDIPAPDGSQQSYADYFLSDLLKAAKGLQLEMEIVRANEKYRGGFFVPAIEKSLQKTSQIRDILEKVSGHKLGNTWSPVQVSEEGYLKNRQVIQIDELNKTIVYLDKTGQEKRCSYQNGETKLNWRIDWPARWWLIGVDVEPFGRDHAAKGGSYDTGEIIIKEIFNARAPIPVPYDFINQTGDTKKMSKSSGGTITAAELLTILPPEIVWFFVLRYSPGKTLYFDTGQTLMKVVDEFSVLLAKSNKTKEEKHLLELCMHKVDKKTVSNIPFSHLVSSYQASLRDAQQTIDVIKRTEHAKTAQEQTDVISSELMFIDRWLDKYAPDEIKFSIVQEVNIEDFNDNQRSFFANLAKKISKAPKSADGEWFHQAIYDLKETTDMTPKQIFSSLYQLLIGKSSGPRAGWFISILPRDWLIRRLHLEE